jgi:murein DD-endopeptidase
MGSLKDFPELQDSRRTGLQRGTNPLPGVAIFAVAMGLFAGGLYWLSHRGSASETPQASASTDASLLQAASVVAALPDVEPAKIAADKSPGAPSTGNFTHTVSIKDNFSTLKVTINGPLESTIVAQAGKSGTALTQVISRTLVWWFRVPQDIVKGDELSVVYESRDGKEPVVHAVKYTSGKFGKSFEAWRYKAKGETFARFYQLDGSELEERLVNSPLEDWEQITSLLRDGRKHKGVDFKTPVGTQVHATFDGVIKRKNWNFRGNGNSLEIEEAGGQGLTAMYLHLSELPKTLVVGQRVKKGQEIALTGNSGHSFAPHLHYQLMSGEKVIDPFANAKTIRLSLGATELPKLESSIAALKKRFPLESWAQR